MTSKETNAGARLTPQSTDPENQEHPQPADNLDLLLFPPRIAIPHILYPLTKDGKQFIKPVTPLLPKIIDRINVENDFKQHNTMLSNLINNIGTPMGTSSLESSLPLTSTLEPCIKSCNRGSNALQHLNNLFTTSLQHLKV